MQSERQLHRPVFKKGDGSKIKNSNIFVDWMKRGRIFFFTIIILVIAAVAFIQDDNTFLSYRVDPKNREIKLYWKDEHNQNFSSIKKLKTALEKGNRQLVFAMNGGMYKHGGSPQGLYIQNKITLSPLDTTTAGGNFYH
jgi:uncharacterized protein YigE (DUF2233 family)